MIICTNIKGKFHLTHLFLSLTNIIIHPLIITIVFGFIIIPTCMIIITSFLLIPAWFLVTIWVGRRLYGMYICPLSGIGRHRQSWPSYRLV